MSEPQRIVNFFIKLFSSETVRETLRVRRQIRAEASDFNPDGLEGEGYRDFVRRYRATGGNEEVARYYERAQALYNKMNARTALRALVEMFGHGSLFALACHEWITDLDEITELGMRDALVALKMEDALVMFYLRALSHHMTVHDSEGGLTPLLGHLARFWTVEEAKEKLAGMAEGVEEANKADKAEGPERADNTNESE